MCVPQGGIETVLSSWMGASCDLARKEENGPLSDVLLAISIQKTETIWSKVNLCQSALELYQKALAALRSSLQGPIVNEQHEMIILTCFACCMFEVSYFLWSMEFGLDYRQSYLSVPRSFPHHDIFEGWAALLDHKNLVYYPPSSVEMYCKTIELSM